MQQITMEDTNPEYAAFVEKFKPRKTTDDCYTPPAVMAAVQEYVANRYGYPLDRQVRPFFPGRHYDQDEYPDGVAVVDNPPFSILSPILDFYAVRQVPYFLFCPTLTCFNFLSDSRRRACIVLTGNKLTYENGADINTSFVTNMEDGIAVMTAPDLYQAIRDAVSSEQGKSKRAQPKYVYPENVLSSKQYALSHGGTVLKIRNDECTFIRSLDSQKQHGKQIFGAGLLLSDAAAARAAAARAAAARAAVEGQETNEDGAIVWPLSPREREIIETMNQKERGTDGETPRATELPVD